MTTPIIAPGAHIQVRDAVWRVLSVDQTSAGTPAWTVIGVSEIVRDQEAIFLADYERDEAGQLAVRVLDPKETLLVSDPSEQHRGLLVYLEALLRDVPPAAAQVCIGHRAALDLLDYQLDPARLALGQLRPRILIADAVGLGKTLEAGILLSELIRRGRARRILVVTVKSMLTQFQKELWSRFTIPLVRLDSVGLQRIRERIPTNHNPFYHFDRVILSMDTLKQRNALRRHLEQARWDVVVIDEAHNVAERGAGSLRAQLATLLASKTDALVLLSATPHDGRPESFASLMNLLDPTAIANPKQYAAHDIKGLYTRRFKQDVQHQIRAHFPDRTISKASFPATDVEEGALAALANLDLKTDQGARGGVLFRTTLEKAFLSSPFACRQTLEQRIATLEEKRKKGADVAEDIDRLALLRSRVGAITKADFSRYHRLVSLLRPTGGLGWSGRAWDDRLVVFTERIETLKFLHAHLPGDLGLDASAVGVLHGTMLDVDQQTVVEEFGKRNSKIRLLLASDVASEGINLHYLCHRMVHFDVPWSLMAFQQRNGRIDRYGQEQVPSITYLLLETRNEGVQGDVRILDRLIEKENKAALNIEDPRNLVGVPDVDEQEALTAKAMQDGLTPDAFEAALGLGAIDPLELLLGTGAEPAVHTAPPVKLPSLFPSDRAWLSTALDLLRDNGVRWRTTADRAALEIEMPPDLRRRFQRLPPEVKPDDNWLVLSDVVADVQAGIKDARAQESAWPRVQLLWPLHPVFGWVADRLRGRFGRHQAPVACLPSLPATEVSFLVSGLVPNRQGQAVVHRWYAAVFEGDAFRRLEPFDAWLARTRFGQNPTANLGAIRLSALQRLLATAVQRVDAQARLDRDAADAELGVRLEAHRDRMAALRERQEAQLTLTFADQRGAAADDRRAREQRRIQHLFDDVDRWARNALTTERTPYLQVLAAVCGAGWREGGGA
jgi:superfamily II DNA or RNA helicase